MHSGRTRARAFLSMLSALAVSEGAAAAPGPGIGPTSRASLEIRVSVAERAGLRMVSAVGIPTAASPEAGPCLWSSARTRTFDVRLEPLDRPSGRPALPSFEIMAGPAASCSGNMNLGKALGALASDDAQGPYLLILAPQ